jgi:hypothetical protein
VKERSGGDKRRERNPEKKQKKKNQKIRMKDKGIRCMNCSPCLTWLPYGQRLKMGVV